MWAWSGLGGWLNQFTKNVLETVLNAELSEHLGHEHGGIPIELGMRNGMRTKTVLTGIGPVEIGVSRDREGSFGLVVVSKCKRRLDGMLSLTVCGWMIGEIAAHFDEVCGAKVSEDTISRISEKVSGGFAEWASRLLGPLYLVFFVGVIVVRVRGGQVRNVPFYVVMGVTVNGERDILGIWAGDGGHRKDRTTSQLPGADRSGAGPVRSGVNEPGGTADQAVTVRKQAGSGHRGQSNCPTSQ